MKKNHFSMVATAISIMVLTACGGGGGGVIGSGSGQQSSAEEGELTAEQSEEVRATLLAAIRNQDTTSARPRHRIMGSGATARITAEGLNYSSPPWDRGDGWVEHDLVGVLDDPDNPSKTLLIRTSTDGESPLSFGWWISGTLPAAVEEFTVFHGGPSYTAPNLDSLTGSATYKGLADGWYVFVSGKAHGKFEDDPYGYFAGEATLTADFGDRASPGSIAGSVAIYTYTTVGEGVTVPEPTEPDMSGGSGSEFQGNPDWTVKLGSIPLTSGTGTFASSPNAATANVGGTTAHGSWEGAFRGNVENPTAADTAPLGVTGQFDVHSENVSILGVFGATRQQ